MKFMGFKGWLQFVTTSLLQNCTRFIKNKEKLKFSLVTACFDTETFLFLGL